MKIIRNGKEYELDMDELRQAGRELKWLEYRNNIIMYGNRKGYDEDEIQEVYLRMKATMYEPPSDDWSGKDAEPFFLELCGEGKHWYKVRVEYKGHRYCQLVAHSEDEAIELACQGEGYYDDDEDEWDEEKFVSAELLKH